mmetsp:Transcript_3848/g.6061  ORF Transcript_3848/g.6061 Transcript_3848/m.6061 type:complete len:92 (+) Transcript_3848:158-433(+)
MINVPLFQTRTNESMKGQKEAPAADPAPAALPASRAARRPARASSAVLAVLKNCKDDVSPWGGHWTRCTAGLVVLAHWLIRQLRSCIAGTN